MNKISVVIVDDHAILREGLKTVLLSDPAYDVIGEATNGNEAIETVLQLKPDIVIMDIAMPGLNGIEATKIIKQKHPGMKVLILTMHDNYNYILDALSAGINGYILKISDMSEIFKAIEQIMKGEDYFAKDVTLNALRKIEKGEHVPGKTADDFYLTKREKEVLKLIAEGHTYRKIAELLFISHYTVINHRQNIIQKLGLNNNAELVKFAIKYGFLETN